jgi:hypothetical protein
MQEGTRRAGVLGFFAIASLIACAESAAPSDARVFSLRITGNQPAAYALRCCVGEATLNRLYEQRGRPPLELTFRGRSLSCRIVQLATGGRLAVMVVDSHGATTWTGVAGKGSIARVDLR